MRLQERRKLSRAISENQQQAFSLYSSCGHFATDAKGKCASNVSCIHMGEMVFGEGERGSMFLSKMQAVRFTMNLLKVASGGSCQSKDLQTVNPDVTGGTAIQKSS